MRLLIVGELYGQLGAASNIARTRGARVAHTEDLEGAMTALRAGQGADVLLVEVGQDIEKLITMLVRERFNLPVIACGVDPDKAAAVRAIKAGAKEYLPLPPNEELIAAVLEAITEETKSVIYASPVMGKVLEMAKQIAPSDASVLITGESGTGKEVMARFIHEHSKRKNAPMISVNCAAIPENLLESELFGHEKGAFTGAVAKRIGKFEEADGGTMFLDEISEMDLKLQAKLLRVLQEREVDRVGGSKPVKVDIRIIATSNRDLPSEAKSGNFREDLYYRLNVINLELPALRQRPEDIAVLAQHFIEKYSEANGVPVKALSDEAVAKIDAYHWPGNVRELENAMHRGVLLAQGKEIESAAILLSGMPQSDEAGDTQSDDTLREPNGLVGRTIDDVEQEMILSTLDHCLGNRTQAAKILGISIRTLRNKLRDYSDEGIAVTPAASA